MKKHFPGINIVEGTHVESPEVVRLPHEIGNYVDKIALHAYKVTDADIAALLDAGYSEDAIFELTLSAALGAGITRLKRGMAALAGGDDAA